MRRVSQPSQRPFHCAVIPSKGAGSDRSTGWIDTGNTLKGLDSHVYVSQEGAESLSRFIGWYSPQDLREAQVQARDALARVEELEEEIARMDGVLQALDTIESAGFRARNKPGRPKKQEVPA